MTKEKLRSEQTTPKFKEKIFESKGRFCANCGSKDNLHIHHIVPVVNGGTNKLSNIAVLCFTCHCKAHNKEAFKPHNAGRKGIKFEDHEETLHDFFNLKIGTKEAKRLIGISNTSKDTFLKLKKQYQNKYKVPSSFRNDIDIKAAQEQRMVNRNS